MEAFSPLVLDSDGGDRYRDSSLQVAVFTFRAFNGAGEAREVSFALACPFPNLVANHESRVNHGHAYENWFKDSWEVARYALENRARLGEGTREWQMELLGSTLPRWLSVKLINDLFPVYSNSWYTRNYSYSVNEAPTDMRGCMGTIDQRSNANAIVEMSFLRLGRTELRLFAEQQITPSHPARFGSHWSAKTGDFDLVLDRLVAIRHEIGWDNLVEGGLGTKDWANLHWPDI